MILCQFGASNTEAVCLRHVRLRTQFEILPTHLRLIVLFSVL